RTSPYLAPCPIFADAQLQNFFVTRVSSARSESFIFPKPSARATTSTRGSPISSTPCCTSTRRGRSSRSSAVPWSSAKSRRHFRRVSEETLAMPILDIPRTDWAAFLDAFSRQHERWLITIEVLTPELGAHREVR